METSLHRELKEFYCDDDAGREVSPGDVHLDREPEQMLREIVVEECRDLKPFVLTLLRHAVRSIPQCPLAPSARSRSTARLLM